jgi:ABC-type uncharacterized transport system permease subunit
MSPESSLFGLSLLLYFLASISYHLHLFAGNERARRVATFLVIAGVAVHTGAIGYWCVTHRGSSLLRDPGMPFSLAAYFVAIIQVLSDFRGKWASVGSLSIPLVFVAHFYSLARTPGSAVQAPPGSPLLSPHVMAILLGFAAFTLAFCMAVIYLVQSRMLKTKQLKGFFRRLPPLESVSTGAHWLAVVGFSMPEKWGPDWYLDARLLSALVAWVIYAAYLAAIMLMGWRGRRTTYFLIVGYVVVLVAFLASVVRPKSAFPPDTGSAAGSRSTYIPSRTSRADPHRHS